MIEWEHFCSLFMIVNQLFVIIICLHVDNVSPGEPSPNSSCYYHISNYTSSLVLYISLARLVNKEQFSLYIRNNCLSWSSFTPPTWKPVCTQLSHIVTFLERDWFVVPDWELNPPPDLMYRGDALNNWESQSGPSVTFFIIYSSQDYLVQTLLSICLKISLFISGNS